MEALRSRFNPEELLGRLASLVGIIGKPEPVSAWELISEFDWGKVPTKDIVIPDIF